MIRAMNGQEAQRGINVGQRAERLGISVRELSDKAGVSRGATSRAVAGEVVRGATLGQLEATLDQIEAEIHGERMNDEERVTTVELPDGTRVTFKGGSASEAVEFAELLLAKLRGSSAASGMTIGQAGSQTSGESEQ